MAVQGTERVLLRVPNISCMHCIRTITHELQQLDGVLSVHGSVERREVEVEYRHECSKTIETITGKLQEIGYPVSG